MWWCPNTGSHFLQGHDQKALYEVIKSEYGSVVEFLRHHDYSFGGEKVN